MQKNKQKVTTTFKKIDEENTPIETKSPINNNNDKEDEGSELSDLELDKIDNPRQREIVLLAKLKIYQQKVKTKKKLIKNLKETLESDERVKTTMQDRIYELKSRIDNYRETALNQGLTVKGIELDDFNNRDHESLLINNIHNNNEEGEVELNPNDVKRGGIEYMLASSAIANEHQNRIFIINSRTLKGRISHLWGNCLNLFTPFKEDLRYISFKYDRKVQIYFEIHRYLFILSLAILLCYLYFLLTHILNSNFSKGVIYCKFNIPCALFYSSVPATEEQAFSITYVTMTFIIIYFSIMKYISFTKLRQNSKLYDKKDNKFSQFFFTSWDWSTNSKGMYLEKKKRLRKMNMIAIEEINISDKIKSRTSNEKVAKFFFRILSFIFSIVTMLIYLAVIIFAYTIRAILKSKDVNKTTFTVADIIFEIIPTLISVIAGFIFPMILKVLVLIEKWDYKSTVRNQMIIRYFICRITGLASIYFYNINFVILKKSARAMLSLLFTVEISTFGCPGASITSTAILSDYIPIANAFYSECAEDDAVINILLIVCAEFIIKKLWDLVSFSFLFCCTSGKRNRGESYKLPFRTGKTAVDVFMLFLQLVAVITYFPFIVVLIPFFMYTGFKFEKLKLLKMRSKPLLFNIFKENGSLIMELFGFTVFLIMIFNTFFYITNIPHSNKISCYSSSSGNQAFEGSNMCGPYANLIAVSSTLLNRINSIYVLSLIYYTMSNPETLIILLIIVISLFLYKSDDVETYKFYVKEIEKGKVENLGIENKNLVVDKLNRRD